MKTIKPRDYRQIIRFASETPWAILPSTLAAMKDILRMGLEGVRLTDEEVEQRIGAARPLTPAPRGGSVAVVPIIGTIVPHTVQNVSGGGTTSIDGFLEAFREAVADDDVSTIILDVHSPGGSVYGLTEAAAEIREARNHKRVVGCANHMAASAAYYLLSQAAEVVVSPSGQVGSIGTIGIHEDISKALEMEGVNVTVIAEPEHKADEAPFEPLSEEALAEVQRRIHHYYRQFVNDVAKGRGVDAGKVESDFGRGRMLEAPQALKVGMVDRVATIDQEIRRALSAGPSRSGRGARAELEAVPGESVAAAAALSGRPGTVELVVDEVVGEPLQLISTFTSPLGASSAPAAAVTRVVTPAGGASAASTNQEGSSMRGINELLARQSEIEARQQELDNEHAGQLMPEEAQAEFDTLDTEWHEIDAAISNINDRRTRLEAKAGRPRSVTQADRAGETGERNGNHDRGGIHTNAGRNLPGNVFDLVGYRQHARSMDDLAGLYREGARRVASMITFETDDQDKVRAHVDKLLSKDTPDGEFARRVIAAGSPLYEKAFTKTLQGRQLSIQEQAVLSETVAGGSGIAIPITIDPTVTLTSDGSRNAVRAISRTVTITGRFWRGITMDGVTASYDAELEEVGDDSPTFLAPEAEVEKAQAFVPFSIEVDQDFPSLREELANAFRDAKDNLEADKFLHGDGDGEPQGIIEALTGSASEVETAAASTLALGDIDLLANDLPPRFEANASFLASRAIYAKLRELAGDRADFWVSIRDQVGGAGRGALMSGYPTYTASGMATTTADSALVLLLGDFQQFVIVDRVGLNVELVPHMLGANRRPIGARGLYAWWRNTSQVKTINAFRLLKINPV